MVTSSSNWQPSNYEIANKASQLMTEFRETIIDNPYIPHRPFDKQIEYLLLPDQEAFYGGQGGGGKSDALLMSALQYVQEKDYSALILRQTLTELKKSNALIDRSHKWLDNTDAKWNGSEYTWKFPSGARLDFGYLANEHDLNQYDSAEYQCICVDELTAFTEYYYTTMFGRLRKLKKSQIPIRMRGGSNPGKQGHKWVKERFVRGPFAFVPATYLENPFINHDTYYKVLMQLPAIKRKQLMDGDWDIGAEGGLFNRLWFAKVPSYSINDIHSVVRYWDLAATEEDGSNDPDYTVGVLGIRYNNGRMVVADVIRDRLSPHKTDELLKKTIKSDYFRYGTKLQTWFEQEGGGQAKRDTAYIIRMLAGYKVFNEKVSRNKEERAGNSSSYAEAGNIDVLDTKFSGWTDEFLEELDFFPNNTEHDDQVDAFSGCYNKLYPVDAGEKPGMDYIDLG